MDVIGVGYEDGVRCYDMATGKVNWTIPNPTEGFGCLDRDTMIQCVVRPVQIWMATDEMKLCIIDNILFCLGSSSDGTKGEIRWKMKLPQVIGPPTVVSLDKEGTISILVVGSDGYVYCIK